jgi:hypothetical protein
MQRRIHEDFNEWNAGLVMSISSHLAIRDVWRDEGCEHDARSISKEF